METLSLFEPIYDAILDDELDDFEYLYLKQNGEFTVLITVYDPGILQQLFLWLKGYRFLLAGYEILRLFEESPDCHSFCQALSEF